MTPGRDAALRAACADEHARRRVARDVADGVRLHVTAVPTFFLDGQRLPEVFIALPDSGEPDPAATGALWNRLMPPDPQSQIRNPK